MATKTYVRRDSIRGGVSNLLWINDEWTFGEDLGEQYQDINSYENNDSKVFNMLRSLLLYGNIPICRYIYPDANSTRYYLPMSYNA